MAYTEIDRPSDYFEAKLWSGNATDDRAISGLDFAPNWVWIKNRTDSNSHAIFDTVRGATKYIESDTTDAEATGATFLKSFTSDGFTLGTAGRVNANSQNYVSWNWKESATAGFDIVSFTGSGSQRTVSHNLGVKPSMIIVKNRSATENWIVYDKINGAGKFMALNLTSASAASSSMFGVEPTSSVFTVGTSNATNKSSSNMIAYCFAEKQGYSKFSSYVGNLSDDGPFCYTGFKPSFVMVKDITTAENWFMYDNRRPGYNYNHYLTADTSGAEVTGDNWVDFLSNGFKLRKGQTGTNRSGDTYIYMAFAESPFVTSTGIPTTAR